MYFQKIKNINNSFIKSSSYIPEYDLFRSLAIVLVVLFHFFENKLQSGFIGVDIFFTLSGCVISRSIISEISKNSNFSVLNFYIAPKVYKQYKIEESNLRNTLDFNNMAFSNFLKLLSVINGFNCSKCLLNFFKLIKVFVLTISSSFQEKIFYCLSVFQMKV